MDNKANWLALEVERPKRMVVLGKFGAPVINTDGSEAWIEVWSADSERARQFRRAQTKSRLEAQARGPITQEDRDADGVALLVALTDGWNFIGPEGRLDFTPENARALYAAPGTAYISEQVDRFAVDRRNF